MNIDSLPENLISVFSEVKHPAIASSLIDLGIIRDVTVDARTVRVTFAFPFPDIPIEDVLVSSIADPIRKLGYEIEHAIKVMTDQERDEFLRLETEGWQGL